MVGGRELGVECCEVVINYIIKRDNQKGCSIGNDTTMGQAQGRSIAWLYKHMEEQKKSTDKPTSAPDEKADTPLWQPIESMYTCFYSIA